MFYISLLHRCVSWRQSVSIFLIGNNGFALYVQVGISLTRYDDQERFSGHFSINDGCQINITAQLNVMRKPRIYYM